MFIREIVGFPPFGWTEIIFAIPIGMHRETRKKMYRKGTRRGRITIYPPFRIAILFCGRIRGYTHVENYLLDLKKKYNAVVFCSLNKRTKSDYIAEFCSKFGISDEQLNLELTKTQEAIYSSLTLCSDETNASDNGISKEITYSQYFHKYRAFQLLEAYQKRHGITFNCVILFRADVEASEEFRIRKPEANTIYIPDGRDYYGLNDQIAYGDFESMKHYCSGVIHLKRVCDQLGILRFPCSINENLMKRHVENTECRLVRFPYNYELHTKRSEPLAAYDDFE